MELQTRSCDALVVWCGLMHSYLLLQCQDRAPPLPTTRQPLTDPATLSSQETREAQVRPTPSTPYIHSARAVQQKAHEQYNYRQYIFMRAVQPPAPSRMRSRPPMMSAGFNTRLSPSSQGRGGSSADSSAGSGT